jgi:hypothetical protein
MKVRLWPVILNIRAIILIAALYLPLNFFLPTLENTKVKIYRTTFLPAVMYGCEKFSYLETTTPKV